MAKAIWSERYDGASPEAERRIFAGYTRDILNIQLKFQKQVAASGPARASHAKMLLGVDNARLSILPDIADALRVGPFQPGQEYAATVRFSNASGGCRPDPSRDLRGIAIRVKVSDQQSHDFLAANFPTAHVRNARQF